MNHSGSGVGDRPLDSDGRPLVNIGFFSTAVNTRPAINNVSSTILALNLDRKFAYIYNNSGSSAYLKFGVAAVVNEGFRLAPNEMYEINLMNLWTGTIQAIKSGGASVNLDVFEGTT